MCKSALQVPFLGLFWLHCIFVETVNATYAGGLYVLSRSLYPFLYKGAWNGKPHPIIFISTFTNYAIIVYFAASLVSAALK